MYIVYSCMYVYVHSYRLYYIYMYTFYKQLSYLSHEKPRPYFPLNPGRLMMGSLFHGF